MMKIGAQMYTVRDTCQDLNGFADTLARLADMGFKVVQVSGTCPYEGEWLDEQLKKNGLECAITHSPVLDTDPEILIEKHNKFNCEYIGLGYYSFKNNPYEEFESKVRPIVEKFKAAGKKFSYHNHSEEFLKINGENAIERMMKAFDKDEMCFTLDTHWVHVSGADPVEWLEKLSGRVPCIHLKDIELYMKDDVKELRYAPVGSGNMNFNAILAATEKAGVKYGLIEQDNCYGRDPFECLKESLDYLRAKGFKD